MRVLTRLAGTLHAILHRNRVDAELDEELREYFAAAADAKAASGMAREEAVRAARAEMGSPAAVKDWVRDVGWESRLENVDREVDAAIQARSPGNSDGTGVRLVRLRDDVVPARLERLVLVLFAAVALTWLVVCANVSTLLMARGAGRSSEMAVRLAVGADRTRLVRQLLVESAVLGAPGGILGGLLAFWRCGPSSHSHRQECSTWGWSASICRSSFSRS